MQGWQGMHLAAILEERSSIDYKESDVSLLEDAIACFYTDSFFCFFGHAAIVPACLP